MKLAWIWTYLLVYIFLMLLLKLVVFSQNHFSPFNTSQILCPIGKIVFKNSPPHYPIKTSFIVFHCANYLSWDKSVHLTQIKTKSRADNLSVMGNRRKRSLTSLCLLYDMIKVLCEINWKALLEAYPPWFNKTTSQNYPIAIQPGMLKNIFPTKK